jgi:phosphoserine phosphatase
MTPLARALGADLVAQRLVADGDRLTGEYLSYESLGDRHGLPHGEAKAAALARHAERAGIDLRRSTAYGDSVHDLPMLELAGTAVAVRPDARLRRVAAARGWAIREW